MIRTIVMTPLVVPAADAHAHIAEMPLLQHGLEHGWLALFLLPLLLLLATGLRKRG